MSNPTTTSQPEARDNFLQIWRGIAVLLVVYYHFSNRVPPEYLGMGGPPSLVFHSGKIGVLIFFIISGYLITKSLTRCDNLAVFYAKRVSRIWPLFIFASFVIFAFLQLVEPPVVPNGPKKFYAIERDWIDLLGSLFFLEDLGFRWMDGVFWSLLVELKFYFWIGILAFFRPNSFGRDFAIIAILLGGFELGITLFHPSGHAWLAKGLNGIFIAQYLPYFATGALLAKNKDDGLLSILLLIAAIQAGIKSASNLDFDMIQTASFGAVLAVLLFADAMMFKSRIILHIGHYSYAYYLFHQMIGLSIIKALGGIVSYDIAMLTALIVTYAISVLASEIAEWRFRTLFSKWLFRLFHQLRLDQMGLSPPAPKILRPQ